MSWPPLKERSITTHEMEARVQGGFGKAFLKVCVLGNMKYIERSRKLSFSEGFMGMD